MSEERGAGPTPGPEEYARIKAENDATMAKRLENPDAPIAAPPATVDDIRKEIEKLKQQESYKDVRDKLHQQTMKRIGVLQDKLLRLKETAGVK